MQKAVKTWLSECASFSNANVAEAAILFIVARHNMGHLPVSVSVIPSPCFINLSSPPSSWTHRIELWKLGWWWRRRVGEPQAVGRLTSAEVGATWLLDVLPAHLIPGGGPLASMTMWWVSSLSGWCWAEGWSGQARSGWGASCCGKTDFEKNYASPFGV